MLALLAAGCAGSRQSRPGPVAAERPTIPPVKSVRPSAAIGPAPAALGSAAASESAKIKGETPISAAADVVEPEPPPTLVASGVDGATGAYLLPPITAAQIAAAIAGDVSDPEETAALRRAYQQKNLANL